MVPTIETPSLPIISFTSPTAASEIRAACLEHGFFQLINHPISTTQQHQTLTTMQSFFSLPTTTKLSLLRTDDKAGYEAIQSQKLEKGTLPDMKEGFYCGQEGHVFTGTKFGENQWPEDEVYKQVFMAYYNAVYELSTQLFSLLAESLGLTRTFFEDFLDREVSLARFLHYPPTPVVGNTRGVGAHTDFGAMTLLWQDSVGGLQIFHPKTKSWIDVEPIEGAYVVNLGDMMQLWTGGIYRITLHRVVNSSGKERYSIAFFNEGRLDYRVKRIIVGEGMEDEEGITVEEHLKRRYKESYDFANSE
jgi:isopenicillin N synthase-like dioxygenase